MQGPRIHPLPAAERDERTQELVSQMALGDGELNIFATLIRHPRLFKQWSRFGGTLLVRGEIPPRERELLILRTAWNTRADYEWGQHVRIGKQTGLTDDEIARIPAGSKADRWDSFDAVLLEAADELHNDARISDGTWAALAERYDEKQLIELTMLVGQYHLVAFTLNSLGVEREAGVEGLPS